MRVSSVENLLADLERQRFYGSLEVKLEAGKIVLLRKTETIKPVADDCRDNRGKHYEREH